MATATLGCNAAANVEGYRVKFSNAEIVCAASSDANAVFTGKQSRVTAQATNVAVGSRVAYASASLQAECNLTANSGKAIFAIRNYRYKWLLDKWLCSCLSDGRIMRVYTLLDQAKITMFMI